MAVKYRNLGDREVICKGDQFLMYNNKWCEAMSLGNTPCDVGIRYRRPIDGKPRKTVRSAVQQRKAEIALCHLKGVVCGFQYTSKALHCGSSRRCDKATSAVA